MRCFGIALAVALFIGACSSDSKQRDAAGAGGASTNAGGGATGGSILVGGSGGSTIVPNSDGGMLPPLDGKITPVVDRTFPLSEVPDAIRYLRDGRARGKVVITV